MLIQLISLSLKGDEAIREVSTMKKYLFALTFILVFNSPSYALFGPKGKSDGEKRATVRKMSDETLTTLYSTHPEAKAKIQKAAGYAVFSNMGVNLFLLSSGNGYGIAVDNSTGKETFMRMAQLGAGFGVGVKDFRAVFIFKTGEVMTKFIEEGWQFGGQADAAAKYDEQGAAASGAASVDTGGTPMEIYQITEAGVALQVTVSGTKYWKDSKLNK